MSQYLFNKKELLNLINASPSTDDLVAVSVGFDSIERGNENHFIAKIRANTAKQETTGKIIINPQQTDSEGCPYPPGCNPGTTKKIG
jgi:hypothetical protein